MGDIPKVVGWNILYPRVCTLEKFNLRLSALQIKVHYSHQSKEEDLEAFFLPLNNNCLWLNLIRHLFTEQIFLERGPVCYYIKIMENIGNRKRLHVNPEGMSNFFIADCLNELDSMNTPQHVQREQINIVF